MSSDTVFIAFASEDQLNEPHHEVKRIVLERWLNTGKFYAVIDHYIENKFENHNTIVLFSDEWDALRRFITEDAIDTVIYGP